MASFESKVFSLDQFVVVVGKKLKTEKNLGKNQNIIKHKTLFADVLNRKRMFGTTNLNRETAQVIVRFNHND